MADLRPSPERLSTPMVTRVLIPVAFLLLALPGAAQQSSPTAPAQGGAPAPAVVPTQETAPETSPRARFEDPYEAYQAGAYDQALQGFVDAQVERPDDPALSLNTGSAHYKMKNYAEAEKAFANAALSGDPQLRQQALYNLGNCAFRQGKLEPAVELYKTALELNPDDADAKFNLEFVRDEIRRRHEEAQKRQDEQQQNQQQDQQQQDQQQQDQQQDGQQDSGSEGDQPQDGQQQQGPDQDQDGLPDATERSAANPTDPQNPDTDGDQIPDGQEDRNGNGQVDPDETDPNNPDTDGDGIPDNEDPQPTETQQQGSQGDQQDQQQQPQAGEGQPQDGQPNPDGLTPEEAERYLQALEEGRPEDQRKAQRGRRSRQEKDW